MNWKLSYHQMNKTILHIVDLIALKLTSIPTHYFITALLLKL